MSTRNSIDCMTFSHFRFIAIIRRFVSGELHFLATSANEMYFWHISATRMQLQAEVSLLRMCQWRIR